ncbi:MAG: methyltransferase domain-containing protein [Rhodopseudomonas sp.]|nr:methyltransferase domain-containing protein [Rhodopseudomonas sp.]
MSEPIVRFDDGAAYERMMGTWSRIAGDVFLDWLALPPGLRCIDIGCGNGAFTDLLMARCAPVQAHGVDPSPAQLEFARGRVAGRPMQFHQGDALGLPFPDDQFDVATMALVIFFVPQPDKGVSEMARVVKPGGLVASYAWDVPGGGFPMEPIRAQMRDMGIKPMGPPVEDASRMEVLLKLWRDAGLQNVEAREITVQRAFANFEEFWDINAVGASVAPVLARLSPAERDRMKEGTRARISVGPDGSIRPSGRANAIKGRVPA